MSGKDVNALQQLIGGFLGQPPADAAAPAAASAINSGAKAGEASEAGAAATAASGAAAGASPASAHRGAESAESHERCLRGRRIGSGTQERELGQGIRKGEQREATAAARQGRRPLLEAWCERWQESTVIQVAAGAWTLRVANEMRPAQRVRDGSRCTILVLICQMREGASGLVSDLCVCSVTCCTFHQQQLRVKVSQSGPP
ncbi:hypothetical protein JKP88DRAFT_349631 [Tribonema minus]|uniref:Uncharacterized protein n=1 Tax=Tribonema minus TaxID=303371 RepID=A0A835YRM4_9STRA|nr:hypothetical protein JKP88DRAFT_349631 [Tribonema minus]